ncbi:hypothetical protein O181_003817 [Austropuccinia psidii MF-1]|uniref:Uncharacterized protein n=1 Tax=Austropuccinia psidii MF-1 TaxID=1389203 RepID=A0A9Q3BFJ8_9BASI|nr:hypothetical protein [Austropuccinia psidii MF-1]
MHLPSNPELHFPRSEGQFAQDVTSSLPRHEFPRNQPRKQVDYVNESSIPSNIMLDFSTMEYTHPLGPINEERLSTEKSGHKGPPAMVYNPPYQPEFDDVYGFHDTEIKYQDQNIWPYALLEDNTSTYDVSHFSPLDPILEEIKNFLSSEDVQNAVVHAQPSDTTEPSAILKSTKLIEHSSIPKNSLKSPNLEDISIPDRGQKHDLWNSPLSHFILKQEKRKKRKVNVSQGFDYTTPSSAKYDPLEIPIPSKSLRSETRVSRFPNIKSNEKAEDKLAYINKPKNEEISGVSNSNPQITKKHSTDPLKIDHLEVNTDRLKIDKPKILSENPSAEEVEEARKNNFFAHVSTMLNIPYARLGENTEKKNRLRKVVDNFYNCRIVQAEKRLAKDRTIIRLAWKEKRDRFRRIQKILYGSAGLNYRILDVFGGENFELIMTELEEYLEYLGQWFEGNPDFMKACFFKITIPMDNKEKTPFNDIQEKFLRYLNLQDDPVRFEFKSRQRIMQMKASQVLESEISVKIVLNYFIQQKKEKFVALFDKEYNFYLFLRKLKNAFYGSHFGNYMARRKRDFESIKILPWKTTPLKAEDCKGLREHLTQIRSYTLPSEKRRKKASKL